MEHNDSSMIALLPDEAPWVKQDLPHLTLVYSGEVAKLSDQDIILLKGLTRALSLVFRPQLLDSISVDVFGKDDDRVHVVRTSKSDDLTLMRSLAERFDASEYKVYKPHVTVGPIGQTQVSGVPDQILFDRIGLFIGDEKWVYNLSSN